MNIKNITLTINKMFYLKTKILRENIVKYVVNYNLYFKDVKI